MFRQCLEWSELDCSAVPEELSEWLESAGKFHLCLEWKELDGRYRRCLELDVIHRDCSLVHVEWSES